MIKVLGAQYLGNKKAKFCLWAPTLENVSLRIISPTPRQVTRGKESA